MGGNIEVISPVPNSAESSASGTVVRFSIQAKTGRKNDIASSSIRRRIVGLMPNQSHYRLLIVDGQAANRRLLVKLLGPLGFALQEAADGLAAIDIAASWQPHLIWMDLRLPNIDGIEATRRIRQQAIATPNADTNNKTASIHPKIIAFSATSCPADRDAAYEAGCDDFIYKPFCNSDIYDAIARHLSLRYRYENETEATLANENSTSGNIDTVALSEISPKLVVALESATRRLQWNTIFQIIKQIHTEDPALASTLSAAINDFHYTQVLDAIALATELATQPSA